MLEQQRIQIAELAEAIAATLDTEPGDVVALWRSESSAAALRFLDRLPTRLTDGSK